MVSNSKDINLNDFSKTKPGTSKLVKFDDTIGPVDDDDDKHTETNNLLNTQNDSVQRILLLQNQHKELLELLNNQKKLQKDNQKVEIKQQLLQK